ncbi:hypothetical protein CRM22_009662 [Opisthorchis felineus]|uniref:Uncharacterized protein n=1 Tax=Opisthorchis felineus TaxID=147828 RepID=A0A4S2LCW1_OPIFE|nr:hypothetical protein CRM22_009662 [Opisthorchis felineus]
MIARLSKSISSNKILGMWNHTDHPKDTTDARSNEIRLALHSLQIPQLLKDKHKCHSRRHSVDWLIQKQRKTHDMCSTVNLPRFSEAAQLSFFVLTSQLSMISMSAM